MPTWANGMDIRQLGRGIQGEAHMAWHGEEGESHVKLRERAMISASSKCR